VNQEDSPMLALGVV